MRDIKAARGSCNYPRAKGSQRTEAILQNWTALVIGVADHTKFGVRAMCKVCAVSDIDILITDSKAPKNIIKSIEKCGTRVIVAK